VLGAAVLAAPERVGVGLLAGLLELLLGGRQRRGDVLQVALRASTPMVAWMMPPTIITTTPTT
jgi:hypothetical protein